jgi:hypothetical protein
MNTQHTPGPLEQLRSATRSPLALALGAALGGLVPATTFAVAHGFELVRFEAGSVVAEPWVHPGWLLVLGGLLFSAKTVYAWTAAAFDDRAKALGFVVLVEGALLLAPSPALRYVALGYLIAVNALGTGARLALRDRADRAAVEGVHPGEAEPVVELDAPTVDRSTTLTAPAPVRVELPAPRVEVEPAQLPASVELDASLYTRAVEVARGMEALSGAALRRALGVRHNVAAALLAQLEADGVIAGTKNSLGQRQVLLSN